ncbi:hypothetical protein STABA_v1c07120 [Spiroplasma tabanidicola]|uniref:Uncharacterized protein n=1 Tax=Spiroplasma tabanidicola TaxID=324079 RepID=A0A6I6C9E1_9MOLU|nr:hypothetical protein STABA_v1c07120 [Spiroplasma tabanidicola]
MLVKIFVPLILSIIFLVIGIIIKIFIVNKKNFSLSITKKGFFGNFIRNLPVAFYTCSIFILLFCIISPLML